MNIIGVPIDCTGRFTGVERMADALRAAGLAQRLNLPDLGNLPVTIDDPRRDPGSGIIGYEAVIRASEGIRTGVGALLARGERPLVIGGCCTLLIGVFAALRDHVGRVGLAFVDGHEDFYDGATSPTGECADMDLAILTGFGAPGLTEIAGAPPLVAPRDVVALGWRDGEHARADGSPDPRILAPEMMICEVDVLKDVGVSASGTWIETSLRLDVECFWLHLDLDVLDENALPAVDYHMPGGLAWDELARLTRPLAHSPALIGADVTIYNPTLDPDGRYARRIVELLGDIFTP